MSDPLENTPQDIGVKVKKKKRNTGKKYFDWVGWAFFAFLLAASQVYLLDSQNDLVEEQVSIGKDQTIILNAQTKIAEKQTFLDSFQNELTKQQNILFEKQNNLVFNQNELLDVQNERVTQQNQLIESQRRSSYVFMLGNIMNSINEELRNPNNNKRRLSKELIGQVIALSNSLEPYRFMVADTLNKLAYSPERGMLLVFLLESAIYTRDLNAILQNANFTFSYAHNLKIYRDTIFHFDVFNSKFNLIDIEASEVNGINCFSCNLGRLRIVDSNCSQMFFVDIESVDIIDVYNSHLIENLFTIGKIGLLSINSTQADVTEIISNKVSDIEIIDGLIRNISIVSDIIKSMYVNLSIIIDTNTINSINKSFANYSLNPYKRNVYLADFNKYKINNLTIINSFVNNVISECSIDTFYIEHSVLNNRIGESIDCKNLNSFYSIISSHLLDKNRASRFEKKYHDILKEGMQEYTYISDKQNDTLLNNLVYAFMNANLDSLANLDWRKE